MSIYICKTAKKLEPWKVALAVVKTLASTEISAAASLTGAQETSNFAQYNLKYVLLLVGSDRAAIGQPCASYGRLCWPPWLHLRYQPRVCIWGDAYNHMGL